MKLFRNVFAALVVFIATKGVLLANMGCSYGSHGGGGGKVAMLLLTLAAGYGVMVLSQGQKRPLDVLGRFIGGLILIVSFVGLVCVAACGVHCMMERRCGGKSGSPLSHMMESAPPQTPNQ